MIIQSLVSSSQLTVIATVAKGNRNQRMHHMDAEERERTEVLLLLFRMRLLTDQAMAKGVKGTTNI